MPTLCMICEAIGPYNAIAKIAMAEVRVALDAGWRVSVVAHRLDDELQRDVEWLKLYNPPRGFIVKWLSARHFVKRALGGRKFDVVHGHQPQIADLCDLFQCHFLTRVASERGCLVSGSGLGAAIRRWQQEAVVWAEDRYYRCWNPSTRMLFVSELIKREFERLYGLPPQWRVFENAAPPWDPVSHDERHAARRALGIVDEARPVIGYLGGLQRRKGYAELLDAAASEAGMFLLMGGQHTDGFEDERLAGRLKAVGLTESRRFMAACDVLIAPSRFDPCPVVVLEAASRGVPVIASEGVGNRGTLLEFGAGAAWKRGEPLLPVVRSLLDPSQGAREGCRRLVEERSQSAMLRELMAMYERVREERAMPASVAPPSQDSAENVALRGEVQL